MINVLTQLIVLAMVVATLLTVSLIIYHFDAFLLGKP